MEPKKTQTTDTDGESYYPEFSVSFPIDNTTSLIANSEFNRCAYESEWLKYVENTGSDAGPFSADNDTWLGSIKELVFGPRSCERTYYYRLSPNFTKWPKFDKEANKNKVRRCENISKVYEKLPTHLQKYVVDVYQYSPNDFKNNTLKDSIESDLEYSSSDSESTKQLKKCIREYRKRKRMSNYSSEDTSSDNEIK